jgi:hypothetical protein
LQEFRRSPKRGGPYHAGLLGARTEALGAAGCVGERLVAINEALVMAANDDIRIIVPELLRVKGDLLRLQCGSDASVEGLFWQAIVLTRQQGALSFELRVSASLARLLRDQGHSANAKALLQPVFSQFTEGFETTDLKASKVLWDDLR